MVKQNEAILLIDNEEVSVWIAPVAEAARCIKRTICAVLTFCSKGHQTGLEIIRGSDWVMEST